MRGGPRHIKPSALFPEGSVLGDGATGGLDLGLGGGGDLHALEGEGSGRLAVAQDLDRVAFAHGALDGQILGGDLATVGIQLVQSGDVHDLELLFPADLQ